MAKIIHTLESVEKAAERQHAEVKRLESLLDRKRVAASEVDQAVLLYQALSAQATELRSGRPMLPEQRALLGLPEPKSSLPWPAPKPTAKTAPKAAPPSPRQSVQTTAQYRARFERAGQVLQERRQERARKAAEALEALGASIKATKTAQLQQPFVEKQRKQQAQAQQELVTWSYGVKLREWIEIYNRD